VVDRFDFSALAPVRQPPFPAVRFDVLECLAVTPAAPPLACSVRRHRPEHLSDTPCRTAHGNESWAISSLLRATPSATSEHRNGVVRLIANPSVLCRFLRSSLTEAPSLHRHYRLHRSYEPLRHPIRPGLSLASCQLIPTAISAGASRVASGLLCVHCRRHYPAGSMELVRSSVSLSAAFPCNSKVAPAITFSRPAQRSLTLRPARSRSRQATLYIESSDSSVASAALRLLPAERTSSRAELHPLESSAFHGAP